MPKPPDPELIDDENPEWTDGMFASARRLSDLPAGAQTKLGGRPRRADAKKLVSLRLRPNVIDAYQAQGADWRSKMERALVEGLERL
ncbi:MAG: BrnA antitoxin family protein [Caulobacteraceae bacterium]